MARKTTEQSERHTKFVNLLELGVKTKTPLATGLLDTVPLILSFKPSCLAVKTCNKRSRLQKTFINGGGELISQQLITVVELDVDLSCC